MDILQVFIPTKNRPYRLAMALQSLGMQTFKSFRVIVLDNGQIPAINSEEVRNVLDWIFYYKGVIVDYRRTSFCNSVAESDKNLFFLLKDTSGWKCVINDDLVLEYNVLELLVDTVLNYECNYAEPVVVDMCNLLRHSDFTIDKFSVQNASNISDFLKRHRLYNEDKIVPVKVGDIGCVVFSPKLDFQSYDWNKIFSSNRFHTGIKVTKAIRKGALRTGAVVYHNTSESWFEGIARQFEIDREEVLNE